ncbi:MAG: tetratricopeptide repeat protein [Acidobacteriia bacterium]|nr:tetratricopeptide repeat protein [Terriglobia bacterium]
MMRRFFPLLALAAIPTLADTVAVLPFWNSGASAASQSNLDWIGESIAETVRESLGSRGILTLERSDLDDAFRSLNLRQRAPLSEASVIKIGELLDAEQAISGTFEFTAEAAASGAGMRGSLKITARIVDRRKLRLGPEFTETGALEDLATLQAHLAWRALALLAPKLAPPESEFRSIQTPIRLDAEENYVRGLLARDPLQKEKFFLQAAHLDARFNHPCYQLGQMHYQRKEYRDAAEWLEKVGAEYIHYREASFLLGLARFQSGDYAGAQKAFQMIAATVPLGEVYNNLGASESRRNLPQAIDDFRKASDGDPNDGVYRFNLGYALWKKGDFAAAADQFRAVLNRNPDDQMATLLLGRSLKKQAFHATVDARLAALERLKTEYQERAYWQLKSMLDSKPQ